MNSISALRFGTANSQETSALLRQAHVVLGTSGTANVLGPAYSETDIVGAGVGLSLNEAELGKLRAALQQAQSAPFYQNLPDRSRGEGQHLFVTG